MLHDALTFVVDGDLQLPRYGPALFLNATAGPILHRLPADRVTCIQTFKPTADALQAAGYAALAELPVDAGPFDLVLVLPPRQREAARALLAEACDRAAPDGMVLAAAANQEGARTHEADLARLAPLDGTASKHKARVFWTRAPRDGDPALRAEYRTLDRPRPIAGTDLISRPGLFAWDRIDPGSALLAAHLPADLSGTVADLGAGVGYLARAVLQRCPQVTEIDLYEAEARAIDLARENLQTQVDRVGGVFWHDVTRGLRRRYDAIVMNPPFHVSGASDVDLGRRFIQSAADALGPKGRLLLVANRHLPYEAVLAERFASVTPLVDEAGYKVIHAVRGRLRA